MGTAQPHGAGGPSPGNPAPDEPEKHQHKGGRNPASEGQALTDDDLIDQSLQKLKQGHLAYSTPEKMKTGESRPVTARIGSDQVDAATLSQGMGQDGETVGTASTPVSVKMRMTLKSADFDITPLSSEEQVVDGPIPTAWEWSISPKHSGTLRLHLDATVELRDVSRDFTTVDRDIAVAVDPKRAMLGFIEHNWQWILSTLAAGVALWWKFFGPDKKKST